LRQGFVPAAAAVPAAEAAGTLVSGALNIVSDSASDGTLRVGGTQTEGARLSEGGEEEAGYDFDRYFAKPEAGRSSHGTNRESDQSDLL